MNKSHVKELLFQGLAPKLLDFGFRARKKHDIFVRNIAGGAQILSLAIVDYYPLFRYTLSVAFRFDEAAEIFNKFAGVPPAYGSLTDVSTTNLAFFVGEEARWFAASSEEEFGTSFEKFSNVIFGVVVPFVIPIDSLEALDRLAELHSGKLDNSELYSRALKRIVVAGLSSNPRLDEIVQYHIDAMIDYPEFKKKNLRLCAEYVKSIKDR